MRRLATIMTGLLVLVMAEIAPQAALAQPWHDDVGYHERGPGDRYGGWRGDRRRRPDGYRGGRGYGRDGDYRGRGGRGRYGGRYRRCRDDGTGGTIIGAIAGGLLGNSIAGRGDRTLGTIVGGGAGALAGRAIDRDCR